jgi:hypothetical protein
MYAKLKPAASACATDTGKNEWGVTRLLAATMPAAAPDTFMNARRSSLARPLNRASRSSMYLVSTLLTPGIFFGRSMAYFPARRRRSKM